MKYLIIIFIILLAGCGNTTTECEPVNTDQAKQVIVDYFRAISDKDFEGLKRLSTEDYILYEDGLVWSNDSLINSMKKMPQARIDYRFENFSFEADCNGVFVNYLNHGSVTVNDTSRIDINWVESAYVRKVDEQLKLDFLHSTVAK
ncbi:hypothetical protein D770_12750 [Flammeovirgaceae bacterium 311]|nr:hypothetical protein D770_12750 [Flammeovirgaceae bacterium 311]